MIRREIVRRAIYFNKPPRLPRRFPECNDNDFSDITTLDDRCLNLLGKEKYTKDEWGCLWQTELQGSMGNVVNIVIDSWGKLSNFNTPNPDDPLRYKKFDYELKRAKNKYVLVFNHFLLFERMRFLVGFKELLESFYLNRQKVEKLADMIVDFQVGIIRNLSKRYKNYLDGMWVTDDWGTQTSLFISKEMWEDIFKARYKIIVEELKDAGMDLWFHSCGKINKIINDLTEIGVKVINTFQPNCLGIKEIGKKYKDKICFETTIDIQNTILRGENAIRNEAYAIVRNWSSIRGGLIITNFIDDIGYKDYQEVSDPVKLNKLIYKYFNEAYKKVY